MTKIYAAFVYLPNQPAQQQKFDLKDTPQVLLTF
jgi:hypothetical protein